MLNKMNPKIYKSREYIQNATSLYMKTWIVETLQFLLYGI